MAFDDLVREMVSLADNLSGSLQSTVVHKPWIGSNQFGEPSYGPDVVLSSVVDYRQTRVKDPQGETQISKASITFTKPIAPNGAPERQEPVDSRDQFILPDGTTGEIINIEGVVDPDTNRPYQVTVWLG